MRDILVANRLEQTKESGLVSMNLKMELVADRSDSPDDLTPSPRKEQLDRSMLVKGMFCRVDELTHVAPKRRNPVRIVAVQPEWQLYEFVSIAIRPDRVYANGSLTVGQIRSISRPTVWNASSTKSSCESVWVAM